MPILRIQVSGEGRNAEGDKVPLPPGVALANGGPRVQTVVTPLEGHLKFLTTQGEEPPAPVAGHALIDTGALVTCIDQAAAMRAGLACVDSGPLTSATHTDQIVPVFAGRLTIEGFGQINALKCYGANLEPQGLIALIGRDLLSNCVLVYDGHSDTITLAV